MQAGLKKAKQHGIGATRKVAEMLTFPCEEGEGGGKSGRKGKRRERNEIRKKKKDGIGQYKGKEEVSV